MWRTTSLLRVAFGSVGLQPPSDVSRKYALKMGGLAKSVSTKKSAGSKATEDATATIVDPSGNLQPSAAELQRRASRLDHHAYAQPKASGNETRAELMKRRIKELEANADTILEVADGGEGDIDLGGMPADVYHDKTDSVVVPSESSLYQSVLNRNSLASRARSNSWMTVAAKRLSEESEAELRDRASSDVAWARDEGVYSRDFDDPTLAAAEEHVQYSQSVYTHRKLHMDGLEGYTRIITRDEELQISAELMQLLQRPTAKYIPQEHRYCVNLFEKKLGLEHRDPLAFCLEADAPTLHSVLMRFFSLELIPAVPNVVQVSEMAGDNAGYPPHIKHHSIGSYFGILNLVTHDTLYLTHRSAPWFPRVHMEPRSLLVVSAPVLHDFAVGYKKTHKTLHEFRDGLRTTKDYRIEVLFATVDAHFVPYLGDAVSMTDYHEAKSRGAKNATTSPLLESSRGTGSVAAGVAAASAGSSRTVEATRPSVTEILRKLQDINQGAATKPQRVVSADEAKRMLGVIASDFKVGNRRNPQ